MSRTAFVGNEQSGAEFSPCRLYRYTLWRRWAEGPTMLWLMLNPSTADETKNDPTVERCQRRAVAGEYGAVEVCNIFAYRSTDPRALRQVADPVGPENDAKILERAKRAACVVCGWGSHGGKRGFEVAERLVANGIHLHCLGLTGQGQPKHPLYVPYSDNLCEWVPSEQKLIYKQIHPAVPSK
jgi:hypothetical protein